MRTQTWVCFSASSPPPSGRDRDRPVGGTAVPGTRPGRPGTRRHPDPSPRVDGWRPQTGSQGSSRPLPHLQASPPSPRWVSAGAAGTVPARHGQPNEVEREMTLCKQNPSYISRRPPQMLKMQGLHRWWVSTESRRHEDGGGTHPEGGVEVDLVGAAHLVVLLFRTVQGGDSDGSGPV